MTVCRISKPLGLITSQQNCYKQGDCLFLYDYIKSLVLPCATLTFQLHGKEGASLLLGSGKEPLMSATTTEASYSVTTVGRS